MTKALGPELQSQWCFCTVALSEDALVKNDPVTIGFATDELATDAMPLFFASKPTFVALVDEKQPKEAKSISSSSVTTSS